jgi:putative Mn2+ efflux pump MntP
MDALELISIGVVVGLNNFAVALMLGALGQAPRRWRIAGVFGVFEFTVPLIGLLIGSAVAGYLAGAGRFIGAGLLVLLGLLAMRSANREGREGERLARRVTTRRGLVALALGLTLDNLVVGFALGLGDTEPLLLAATIAAFAVTFTLIGLELGRQGRKERENLAQRVSGLLLVVLGLAVALGWPG